MTANELADALDTIGDKYLVILGNIEFKKAATMLRQQQADYYSLLVNHDKLYAKVVEQQAEIESLKAKTLTDEEIYKIANSIETIQPQHGLRLSNDLNVMDFARAILRKAQKK